MTKGATISFHNIGYSVQERSRVKRCAKEEKQVITNVSGIFKPGMNAILGPTGGGKTSLLDILAGRCDKKGLEGVVLVDGKPQPKNFKLSSGYVLQEDLAMGTLTVRENVMFSVNLRLPKSIGVQEKIFKVEEVLQELGLNKCADTKVGTEFTRGVSGGEKKRVCIGMELVISPSVLFLDEPTSGLDASTASSVMACLHKLSQNGHNIIFSIHQPRYDIFKLFDNLLLLSKGSTVYHGKASMVLGYFTRLGYVCEKHNNPADFFLDVINSESTSFFKANGAFNDEMSSGLSDKDRIDQMKKMNLHKKYEISSIYEKINDELGEIYLNYVSLYHNTLSSSSDSDDVEYANSFPTQMTYLAERAAKNLFRNPQAILTQFAVTAFFGFLCGILYFQIGNQLDAAIQNRMGVFYFIVINQLYANVSSIEIFIKEKKLFMHESASGFYRLSSYFFAKLLCDLVPGRFIPVTAFSFISYFMIGLQLQVDKFFIFYLCIFLTALSSSTLGFFISSSSSTFTIGYLYTSLVLVFMMLFGGFLVNLNTMTKWLSWLQYFSIARYSLNTLSINELHDLVLYNGTKPLPIIGKTYLRNQGIKFDPFWHFWMNPLALVIIVLIFMVLAYIQLRRLPKLK